MSIPVNEISMKSFDSDLNDCLSQYLNAEAAATKVPNPFAVPNNKSQRNLVQSNPDDPAKIFSNKKFQILGFLETEADSIEKVLQEQGALVVRCDTTITESSFRQKELVDYTILPMTIHKPISYPNPVTVYWTVK